MKSYLDRKPTRYEHQVEIIRAYDLTPFAEVAAWIADQAWTTGDGPKALLPGIATLERLVVEGKQAADQRAVDPPWLDSSPARQREPTIGGWTRGLPALPAPHPT